MLFLKPLRECGGLQLIKRGHFSMVQAISLPLEVETRTRPKHPLLPTSPFFDLVLGNGVLRSSLLGNLKEWQEETTPGPSTRTPRTRRTEQLSQSNLLSKRQRRQMVSRNSQQQLRVQQRLRVQQQLRAQRKPTRIIKHQSQLHKSYHQQTELQRLLMPMQWTTRQIVRQSLEHHP